MSTFIVRVQLTHEKNYALLTEMLLKAGFTDKIKDENGSEYLLPTGNYLIEAPDGSAKAWVHGVVKNVTVDIIRKEAFYAESPMILIIEAKEKRIFWSGLKKC